MLNFHEIIPAAATTAGSDAIVAAPYPLPEVVCRGLVGAGVIAGYVADRHPEPGTPDPSIAGWWVDRPSGSWFIRSAGPRTMILLGIRSAGEVTGQMLLEARLKGIRRMLFAAADGSITDEIEVASALSGRLSSAPTVSRLNYDDMFEDVYKFVGDRLRLPRDEIVAERILLITGSLGPGGAERQAAYTAAGLARRFPGDVYVGCTLSGGRADFFRPDVEAAGVHVSTVPKRAAQYDAPDIIGIRNRLNMRYGPLGVSNILDAIFHHALLLQRIKPGLVHTWQDYCNVLAGVAACLVGIPRLVFSGRSVAPENFGIFQPYMAPGYRAILKRRDVVFLNNSEAGARDYGRWLDLPRERFHVLHNGFEFPDPAYTARSDKRRELSIPSDAVLIGSIIRFGEEKRPELFIEVARELHRSYGNIRFVMFGDGPLLANCRALVAQHGLDTIVKLPGLASDMWAALSAMDIFVLTSRMEGLPNVMIEAQGMGLPVVCTGVGGMGETFVEGETGFAVHSATVQDLGASIRRLVDDNELRQRMGSKAREFAREKFGVHRMIERTIELYQSAPEAPQPPEGEDGHPESSDIVVPVPSIMPESGHCHIADLNLGPGCDGMWLWENDKRLGPGACLHDDIRRQGQGRYSVWGTALYFSASDNSDPRNNGRIYVLRRDI